MTAGWYVDVDVIDLFATLGQRLHFRRTLTYSRVHNSPSFGLFMKKNAYVPVGGNEGGGRATPFKLRGLPFHFIKWLKFKVLAF